MKTVEMQNIVLGWFDTVVTWLVTSGLAIIIVVALAVVAARIYRAALGRVGRTMTARAREALERENPQAIEKRVATLMGILRSVGVIVIWSVAAVTILTEIGIAVAPLLASAGIAGLAIGFGAQNLVRDVIGGFFILLENQVRVGDVAVINGTGGLVESINLRTVVLRDLAGVVHVFPNGTISTLANMTKGWSAMVFEVGVSYKEDIDAVTDVMGETAEALRRDPAFADKILEPMEIFGVESFGDSAVVIKARQKTKPIEQWTVGREYRRRLKIAFDEKGIEIPFPHRTLYWGNASPLPEARNADS